MGYADYFDKQVARGYAGPGRTPYQSSYGGNASGGRKTLELVDDIDRMWAANYQDTDAPHSYFDYFFAGQDIKVYVDGTEEDPEFNDIPIMEFAFSVSQQKQPLFGYWSYTRDAMMRGVRMVSGQMTLATKSPDYMRRLITRAAKARADGNSSYRYHRGLTEDDSNIEKYWGKHIDPAITDGGKQVFSVHPPFSLVILYGVQNLSINQVSTSGFSDVWDKYQSDYPLALDINERLVESDPMNNANRIILENVELSDFQTGFTPDGAVVSESWAFSARDILIPPRTKGPIRPTKEIL